MADDASATAEAIDFAVIAYRDEGAWVLVGVPAEQVATFESLLAALRRYPGETGMLGFVSVDEDFFILVRVQGQRVRVVLSDVTAADEWSLAREIAEELDIDLDDIDEDNPEPGGDLSLFADLGLDAMALAAICDDYDSFPDELLDDIAEQLGFAEDFREAADAVAG